VLCLPDAWSWDFWLADTGTEYHLFFLRASRALLDPERRHLRAGIGHAVSTDLTDWALLPDALVADDGPAFDDLATWTGSIVAKPEGGWAMFYTGVSKAEQGLVQRVGRADSADLISWRRVPGDGPLSADPRWYETLEQGSWRDESWRDPWVFADPDGDGWHMLLTARARTGPAGGRGVVGHARSADLASWQVQPPLSVPSGFGQVEVTQSVLVEGRPVLLFSCLAPELAADRRNPGVTGGVWSAPGASLSGPFDLAAATALTDEALYSGRLVRRRDGSWALLAFHNLEPDGSFRGGISDPIPVRLAADATVEIAVEHIPTLVKGHA
jgi:hypothetical protein